MMCTSKRVPPFSHHILPQTQFHHFNMEPPLQGVAASSSSAVRPRHTPPERYLSFSYSPPPSAGGDELTEDDIFDTVSPESSSNPNPNNIHHQPRHHLTNFGILAALPASEPRSVFNHKASASAASSSSSTSSSSRMIPTIHHPRRPLVIDYKRSLMHQSAPVNVPVLSAAVEEERRRRRGGEYVSEVDDDDDDDDDGDGVEVQMLPPHEMVAARDTPVVACSVLEGVGRTLKGRDLRRVRNAVFRKTGFID